MQKYRIKTLPISAMVGMWFICILVETLGYFAEISTESMHIYTEDLSFTFFLGFMIALLVVIMFFSVKNMIDYKCYTVKKDAFLRSLLSAYIFYAGLHCACGILSESNMIKWYISIIIILLGAAVLTVLFLLYRRFEEKISKFGNSRLIGIFAPSGVGISLLASSFVKSMEQTGIDMELFVLLPCSVVMMILFAGYFCKFFNAFWECRKKVQNKNGGSV